MEGVGRDCFHFVEWLTNAEKLESVAAKGFSNHVKQNVQFNGFLFSHRFMQQPLFNVRTSLYLKRNSVPISRHYFPPAPPSYIHPRQSLATINLLSVCVSLSIP